MRGTRKALVLSILLLMVCVVMLIGATFAWFTDGVSSGNNHIQAGNLDVAFQYKNADTTEYTNITETTNVFRDGALWEAGHTEYAVIKISNKGNLSMGYSCAIKNVDSKEVVVKNFNNQDIKLSNYLMYAVLEGDKSGDLTGDGKTDGSDRAEILKLAKLKAQSLSASTTLYGTMKGYVTDDPPVKVYTLVVWMPSEVGNEINYPYNPNSEAPVPSVSIGIDLSASQLNSEADSYGSDFDTTATQGIKYVQTGSNNDQTVQNIIDALTGSAASGDKVILPNVTGDNALEIQLAEKTIVSGITVVGNDTVRLNVKADDYTKLPTADNVTFERVLFDYGSGQSYSGIKGEKPVNFRTCTFNGTVNVFENTSNFDACVFNNTSNQYVAHLSGGTANFTRCNFFGNDRNILVYSSNSNVTATFTKCGFNNANQNPENPESAVMLSASDSDTTTYAVTMTGSEMTAGSFNTTTAADIAGNENYNGLYGLRHKTKNGGEQSVNKLVNGTVTINGTVVYPSSATN